LKEIRSANNSPVTIRDIFNFGLEAVHVVALVAAIAQQQFVFVVA
jgi:hypothetical protein